MKIGKLPSIGWKYITRPEYRFGLQAALGFHNSMPDDEYLKRLFYVYMGKPLDLENPQTFNEKLQWLKLHDRKSEYTLMADKYRVREYIANKIGKEYLIPLLGVWDDPDEIDFDALPQQFVLKCNHNSGLGMCICKDKDELNIKKVICGLRKGLSQNYYLTGREWPYKNVPRKIIAEVYMEENKERGALTDYKLMCFNGIVKCCFVCSGRGTNDGLHVTFFDKDWNMMPFERHYLSERNGFPKPETYEKMVELAEILSHNIPFVRVDFYEIKKKIYFSELTFYPGCGFEEFTPEEWDYILGDWLILPKR